MNRMNWENCFSLIDDGERQREMEEEDAEEMAQKG